jgi:hypothetical protein
VDKLLGGKVAVVTASGIAPKCAKELALDPLRDVVTTTLISFLPPRCTSGIALIG